MANRRPTPLKDEPTVPLDELHEQITKLIETVNSFAKSETTLGEQFQNAVSTTVVKAVQDLLEADKGKMSVNDLFQKILDQYEDICGKAKGFYMIYKGADDRFRHIDENLQKICGNEKLLCEMMKSILKEQNIKVGNKNKCPTMPSGFKAKVRHLVCDLPLYWLIRVYRSRHVRLYVKICLFCIWVITIATAAFIAYDNSVLRKENEKNKLLLQYMRENSGISQTKDYHDDNLSEFQVH